MRRITTNHGRHDEPFGKRLSAGVLILIAIFSAGCGGASNTDGDKPVAETADYVERIDRRLDIEARLQQRFLATEEPAVCTATKSVFSCFEFRNGKVWHRLGTHNGVIENGVAKSFIELERGYRMTTKQGREFSLLLRDSCRRSYPEITKRQERLIRDFCDES